MSDLRAAAQQALKAFRKCVPMDGKHAEVDAVFKSLRAALEQDWNPLPLLEATEASLRDHMAEVQRLRAVLEQALEPVVVPEPDHALIAAACAVLARWHSPAWEWSKQGPTAELMGNLQVALLKYEVVR